MKHFVQRLEEYSENPEAKATGAVLVGPGYLWFTVSVGIGMVCWLSLSSKSLITVLAPCNVIC